MLWQVREAVSLPPAPPTGPPCLGASTGVQGRMAPGLSSLLSESLSPGAHGPLGCYLDVASPPCALQPLLGKHQRTSVRMLEQVQLHLDFQGLSDLGTEDVRHQALGGCRGWGAREGV